jgi:hypothetical protein
MPERGPFTVDPQQLEGLQGSAFAEVVGRLLEAESASAGLAGTSLTQTYRANAPDGGIDAGLISTAATEWIPANESAWQFKAGDLDPSKCRTELQTAEAALDVLQRGGSYRLVLGRSLTPQQVTNRKVALEETARNIGIETPPGVIEVLNSDHLARWAEQFPALATHHLIRGIGTVGQTFDEWSSSVSHRTAWMSSESRTKQIQGLLDAIRTGDESGVHIEGVSGVGKTRLVMEALRPDINKALVLYVPSEDQFEPALLSQLQAQGRTVIIIIDECDAKRHDIFAAMLQTGSKIRLITISEPSLRTTRAPTLPVRGFEDEPLAELLETNHSGLWPQATRVIVDVAAGNIDYALKCARALVAQGPQTARQLVNPTDIHQFIVDELPGGALFLASSALALFSRVGFDGELADELQYVSDAFDIPKADLRAAAYDLATRGLLGDQGRYRSVGPNPVAIYLATQGWIHFGPRIVTHLLPNLPEDMTERLFRRAAQIGDSSLPGDVIDMMLTDSGPLRSLASVAEDRRGKLLDYLAILSPEQVSMRIYNLLRSVSDEDLRDAHDARRPLVWALQKLAWRTSTFSEAADSLLRLALTENESFSNNSTGVWHDLFGTFLPATAAAPETRVSYLREQSLSSDARVRIIVIGAARRALEFNEHSIASGELQGGVVVEQRGAAQTYGQSWDYRNAVADILQDLSRDAEPLVAHAAVEALTAAIHGSLDQPALRDHLLSIFNRFDAEQLRNVRAELAGLSALFARVDDADGRAASVEYMISALPAEAWTDSLWILAHTASWKWLDDNVEAAIAEALIGIDRDAAVEYLIRLLEDKIPADYAIGKVVAQLQYDSGYESLDLANRIAGLNARALVGFLLELESRQSGFFDDFLDNYDGDVVSKLHITTQGPRTLRAEARVSELLPTMSVADGARAVFHWLRDVPEGEQLTEHIQTWSKQVGSQEDYRALVDLIAFRFYDRPSLARELEDVIGDVVEMRSLFPDVGQQENDWVTLARRQIDLEPQRVLSTLVELIEAGALNAYPGSQEQQLFAEAIALSNREAWRQLLDRLQGHNSWRLRFAAKGWLADALDLSFVEEWVGGSESRAQTIASVTTVGSEQLNPVSSFLLRRFGDSDSVKSILLSEYVSGMWTGNESDRIRRQLAELQRWLLVPRQSEGAKRWFRQVIVYLEGRLRVVLQGEQEEDW